MKSVPVIEGHWSLRGGPADIRMSARSQAMSGSGDGLEVHVYGQLRCVDAALSGAADKLGLPRAIGAAFRQSGSKVLAGLSGEYVLAIWDAERARGLVAVDRFSTFPLYFAEHAGRFAFASKPELVRRRLDMSKELDLSAIHAYAYFHMIPAPWSVYKGVSRLDIGQMACTEAGAVQVSQHWKPVFVEDQRYEFAGEREQFRSALRQGVQESMAGRDAKEIGCFLSGGTDSSTIAGLATQLLGQPARTFSIAFDVSAYDESHYSRLASSHFKTDHTEFRMAPEDAWASIDAIAKSYEQPFGNSSAVPTYCCAKLAGDAGVQRLLGGDGGDELYGGNERYAKQWIFSFYDRLPAVMRTGVLEPVLTGPLKNVGFYPVRKARGYVEQAMIPLPDRLNSKYNLLLHFGAQRVFTENFLAGMPMQAPIELEREVWRASTASSQINRLLDYDFKFTLGDNDLPKVTRMCHAAGVEVSFPMLADAVVDHSLRLAPWAKLKGTKLRYFFKEALRGFLPDEILAKPKHGFGLPFGDWLLLQPRLSARADEALASLASRGIVRTEFIAELRNAIRQGHAGYYGTFVWVFMMLELWLRESEFADYGLPGRG